MNETKTAEAPDLELAFLIEGNETTSLAVVPANGQRPHGMNIGGNTVTQATEHLPEEQRIVLRAIHTNARERNLTWAQIKHETGLSDNFLYQVWTGIYRYPELIKDKFCTRCQKVVETNRGGGCAKCNARNDCVEKRERPHPKAGQPIPFGANTLASLRAWKARHEIKMQQQGDFVVTTVFERTERVYKRAFKTKKMFFVFGEPQIGKTRTAKELARKYNTGQTVYVDMPPGAGPRFFLKCIAKALHVNADQSYEKLLVAVCEALDPSKAILFDNMHRVFTTFPKLSVMPIMDLLLYIYDSTGCVMGIFATNVFADRLGQGEFFNYLKQFKRRGVYTLRLEDEPERCDLDRVAMRYGLEPAKGEAEAIMLELAHEDGFGVFCVRLQDAVDLAAVKNTSVTWEHFVKAHNIAAQNAIKPKAKAKH
jgi:hypothetical protein